MVNSREKREGWRNNPAPLLLFLDKIQGDLTRGATRQMITLVTGERYSHDKFYSNLCFPFLREKNFFKVVWIERWVAVLQRWVAKKRCGWPSWKPVELAPCETERMRVPNELAMLAARTRSLPPKGPHFH
jgi:hypothetical protein